MFQPRGSNVWEELAYGGGRRVAAFTAQFLDNKLRCKEFVGRFTYPPRPFLRKELPMQLAVKQSFAVAFCMLLSLTCQSVSAANPDVGITGTPFNPGVVKKLTEFGAVGDGNTDDTAALTRAFENSDNYCLDGENKTYKVIGAVVASKSLCLKNIKLLQAMQPFDTTPYVSKECPFSNSAFTILDCGDPVVPADKLHALEASLGVRTLLIRPVDPNAPIQVNLDHVTVNRGAYMDMGSRQKSAGIWLTGANRVDFNNVEITGLGKGFGLMIADAQNVTLNNLNIHDIIWSLYKGDQPLNQAQTAKIGWNSIPIHEFRLAGTDGVKESKFYGVRVQEQVTCGVVARSKHVLINHATVSRCMAQFDTGLLPWQSDGLDIGASSSDILVTGGTKIENVWEGMDIVAGGTGIQNLTFDKVTILNTFGYGLKLGYELTNVKVIDPVIARSGISGIVIYGAVKNAVVTGAKISEMGWINTSNGPLEPWTDALHAGIRLSKGSNNDPQGKEIRLSLDTPAQKKQIYYPDTVTIQSSNVTSTEHPEWCDYGYANQKATNVQLLQSTASGCTKGLSLGF
jgi:hypothetical protein